MPEMPHLSRRHKHIKKSRNMVGEHVEASPSTLLPEHCSSKMQLNGSIDGEEVLTIVRQSCISFVSSLFCHHEDDSALALCDTSGDALTHRELVQFVLDFGTSLHQLGIGKCDRGTYYSCGRPRAILSNHTQCPLQSPLFSPTGLFLPSPWFH